MTTTFKQTMRDVFQRAVRGPKIIASAATSRLFRGGQVKARKIVRGFWDYTATAPVAVADPEKLIHLARPYGGLPTPSIKRFDRGILTLSDKQAIRLVKAMFLARAKDSLRELERLFSGGGVRWQAGYENLVVNEGLDHVLDIVLSGGTQDTSWFVGLLGSSPSPLAAWTATEIASNDFVDYDESTLQAFSDGGVSSQSVDNSASTADFTCDTNSSTIGGAYLIGTNAKATPAGTLYAAGAFSGGNKSLDDNDTISVTATFTSADDGA